ncbi:MAG: primosomal protein N' [Ignavibacterium sp.]
MFAQLVFPLPFNKSFTYSIPYELEENVQIGVRAVAPFGKRILTGFVVGISEMTTISEEIKEIQDVIDDNPIFDEKSLKFYDWLASYYLCSLGEALKLSVPYGTEIQSKKRISIDSEYCINLLKDEKPKSSVRKKILQVFAERNLITLSQLQKLVKKKNIYSQLHSLEKIGAITIHNEIENPKVKAKKIKFVKLNKSLEEIYELLPEIERRSPKQLEFLLKLISYGNNKEIPLQEIQKEIKSTLSTIKSLLKKNIITIKLKEIERKFSDLYNEELVEFNLTEKQKNIIDDISIQIENEEFKVNLLYGITGSGKTQVYIELIKKALALGKTAIILVPEISLTPQITSRMQNHFGESIAVIHSRMSLGERYDSWQKVLKGKATVVIGARSALFAPLKNIGFIVVDEEHDQSYKQDDQTPKYNARDSAVMLAKFFACPILLGSATPSTESMFNAKTGKYNLYELPERVDNAKLPNITLVNIIEEKKKNRMENIFSKTLLEKIDERLKKKEGIIILQNRRGFATQIYCVECGQVVICDNCSVPMVYHINKNLLQCHYCDLQKKVPEACPNCGSLHLKYLGTGTERVEDELEYYFPNIIIERIDSDAIRKKGTLGTILYKFKNGEIDILVGTQMVAKGLDFSRVTLVGVISAETNLWLPDFRADERTFQLLTQVAGRSGRSKVEGEVLIQTQNDKHFVLQKVLMNDYYGFYEREIFEREKRGYPPFTRLALIETSDKDDTKAKGAIIDFYREISLYKDYINITSPSSAIIAKLKGEYRYQIILKSSKIKDPGGSILRKAISDSFVKYNRKTKYSDVKIFFDIDPQSII